MDVQIGIDVGRQESGVARLHTPACFAPQHRSLLQLGLLEHACAQTVFDVVLVVRRGVRQVDDLTLEARALRSRAERIRPVLVGLVLQQALAHLARQIQPGTVGRPTFQSIDHAQDLLVVAKPAVVRHALVERLLAAVAERRVPDVVAQREGFAEGFVRMQRGPDAAGDLAHLEAVRQSRAVVVALVIHEDLGLVHESSERGGVRDPVAIALVARAQRILRFVEGTPQGRGALGRPGGQVPLLARFLALAVVPGVHGSGRGVRRKMERGGNRDRAGTPTIEHRRSSGENRPASLQVARNRWELAGTPRALACGTRGTARRIAFARTSRSRHAFPGRAG